MWRSKETKEKLYKALKKFNEFIFFDVETTGFSAEKNHIIEFSAIKCLCWEDKDQIKIRIINSIDVLINPQYALPPKITELTGITDNDLMQAPMEDEAFVVIKEFLGDETSSAFCGHNVNFDIRFVTAMYGRYGYSFDPGIALDTLEMARDLVCKEDTSDFKLGSLLRLFECDEGLTFHRAIDDVKGTVRLFSCFCSLYKMRDKNSPAQTCVKRRPVVKEMRYWKGFRGNSRIYIHTNLGAFFYDIRTKTWGKKPDNPYELEEIDMEFLKKSAMEQSGVFDEREFVRVHRQRSEGCNCR